MKCLDVAFAVMLLIVPSRMFASMDAPTGVGISGASYTGDGCPQGSARVVVSQDSQALTVIFDRFLAYQGPGISHQEAKRDCRLEVELIYPEGWRPTIASVHYRGFAQLSENTFGKQLSKYRFGGRPFMKPSHMLLKGDYMGDYFKADESGHTPRGWAKCGRSEHISIETSIQVGGPQFAPAYLSIDSLDQEARETRQEYRLLWERCR